MGARANLLIYLELKQIKKAEFYRATGLSNGFLDKNANISSDNIEIIIYNYPDINLYWLITSKGEVLKIDDVVSNPNDLELIELLRARVKSLEQELAQLKHKQRRL